MADVADGELDSHPADRATRATELGGHLDVSAGPNLDAQIAERPAVRDAPPPRRPAGRRPPRHRPAGLGRSRRRRPRRRPTPVRRCCAARSRIASSTAFTGGCLRVRRPGRTGAEVAPEQVVELAGWRRAERGRPRSRAASEWPTSACTQTVSTARAAVQRHGVGTETADAVTVDRDRPPTSVADSPGSRLDDERAAGARRSTPAYAAAAAQRPGRRQTAPTPPPTLPATGARVR